MNERERQEIEELLPWHAAGTLNRADAARVEAALAQDPALAKSYALVREELGSTIQLNETLGAPSPRAMEKLFAKIDAEPARVQRPSFNLGERINAFFANLSPRTLAFATVAAALVIVLQSGLIGSQLLGGTNGGTGETTGYHTASVGTQTEEGAFVLMRFAPGAGQSEVTKFLEANRAQIVDGPKAGGYYRVRVSEKKLSPAGLTDVVKSLQKSPVVSFVAATE
jgi:hypothetical protein